MVRKEDLYDHFMHAQSTWRAMVGSTDRQDRFNSEKLRLKMNLLRDLYTRLVDETDDQVLDSLEGRLDELRKDWEEYYTKMAQVALAQLKTPPEDCDKYLMSIGISREDGMEGVISDIKEIVGEV
jgi:hypothetical protein